jgi:antirestriction protein
MKLEKIYIFMEPYDYNYRGQGFYIYPWSYNSWDAFQKGMEEKKADYPPEVEEWEFVDSDGLNAYGVDMDGISEKDWDGIQELAKFADQIGLDIYDIEKVRSDLGDVDVDYLEESYQGEFDSLLDYSYELLDDIGVSDEMAERYFSFDKFGYALRVGGDVDAMFMNDWEDNYDSEMEAMDALEEFERRSDAEIGEYYVYDLLGSLSELGAETMKDYFDYKAFARDLSYDYDEYFGRIWWNH